MYQGSARARVVESWIDGGKEGAGGRGGQDTRVGAHTGVEWCKAVMCWFVYGLLKYGERVLVVALLYTLPLRILFQKFRKPGPRGRSLDVTRLYLFYGERRAHTAATHHTASVLGDIAVPAGSGAAERPGTLFICAPRAVRTKVATEKQRAIYPAATQHVLLKLRRTSAMVYL